MREILFRGKAYDKKWVEGCLIAIPEYNYFCILEDEDKVHPMDYPYLDETLGTFDGKATPVNPSTICQFTGMTDKNGKRIFENDICKCIEVHSWGVEEFVSKMEWIDYGWWFDTANGYYPLCNFDNSYDWLSHVAEIEVIGNIFDNPELLER